MFIEANLYITTELKNFPAKRISIYVKRLDKSYLEKETFN